jgi:putative aldouronate transport system permease protein
VFYFPIPLILALLLNEIRVSWFKRVSQSFVYLPHFLSWSVLVGLVYLFLGPTGVISTMMRANDMRGLEVITDPNWFRPLIVIELIWKEAGWGTIIYLAALSGVDEQVYEAAVIDGAGRFKQLWHITLPAIRSTIIILLILRMGTFMDTGFEQIFLMRNSLNRSVAEVFDTYVYVRGVREGFFSYATAVGLFKSFVSLVLVLGTNKLASMFGEEGVF